MNTHAPDRLCVVGRADPQLPLRLLDLLVVQGVAVETIVLMREQERYRLTIGSVNVDPTKQDRILKLAKNLVLVETAYWS